MAYDALSPLAIFTTSYDNFYYYFGTLFHKPLRLLDSGVLKGSRQAMSILQYLVMILLDKIFLSVSMATRTDPKIDTDSGV